MTFDAASMAVFRVNLRRRQAAEADARTARRERAWAAARHAAAMLRESFGAGRVVVFGSLVEEDGAFFDAGSDIDMAAWGVPTDDYFLAVAHLQSVSNEFSMDLVAMERCPEYLRQPIEVCGADL